MRGEEHGATLADKRADHLAKLKDAGGVETVGRLIEDQQLGVGEQAARNPQPLAHPLRVARDLLGGALGQPDAFDRAINAAEGLRPADRGQQPKVLATAEVVVEMRLLDDRADPRERVGAVLGNRETAQAHGARVRAGQAEQHPDRRRLAGAVVSEKAIGAAARDAQGHAVDGDPLAEALGELAGLDDRLVGHLDASVAFACAAVIAGGGDRGLRRSAER